MRVSLGTILIAALLAGCSTPGYKQASKTSRDLRELRSDLLDAQRQITRTSSALSGLTGASVDDLQKPYVSFRKELYRLEDTADDMADTASDMKSKGDAYFSSWEKEAKHLADDSLREQSNQRRSDLLAQYQKINAKMQDVSTAFQTAEKDLHDVRDFLDHDLTRTGLSAVAPLSAKADTGLVDVQKKINDVIADLDALSAQFPK